MPSLVLDTNVWVSTILKPEGHHARFIKEIALLEKIQARNKHVPPDLVEREIKEALREVRQAKRT